MHAIKVVDDTLVWQEAESPLAGPGEILIEVHATAINRADLSQRAGGYAPPPTASEVLGLECSGVVVATGEHVSTYEEGDRVCALLAGGGYAEYVNVPAGQALPIPRGLDFVQGASLPEVYATAYLNLFMEAQAKRGETVLLHAGASGVGTAGIQLCRVLGNECFVTAGSAEKVDACLQLGASAGAVRSLEDFETKVLGWTEGQGVNVILDPVGASYLASNLNCLATDGRLVIIGLMGGATGELALGRMMMKRQRVIGSTLRARSVSAKSEVMAQLFERVWPLIESGDVVPVVDSVYPIQEADQAHARLAGNATVGKVVLEIKGA